MRWWKLGLLGLLVLSVGCSSNDDGVEVEESPLGVIFSAPPADQLPSPYDETESISATFNRATGLHEMQFSLFPPAVTGDITTHPDSRRTWTWRDVQFEPSKGAYFWLIDGVYLGRWVNLANDRVFAREPVMVRIPSSRDRDSAVGFAGSVHSPNSNVLATGTLVFALPIDSGFNPLDPAGTFDPTTATGVAIAFRADDYVDLNAGFRASLLPEDTLYIVVAVKDTNDDLHYSPADDWWGMYREGDTDSVWSRLDTGEKDNPFNFGVTITLGPPVSN